VDRFALTIYPYSLDFAFIDFFAITDSEDEYVSAKDGIYHPIVTYAVLAKSGKLPLEYWVRLWLFDQFGLYQIEDSLCLWLGQLLEVSMY